VAAAGPLATLALLALGALLDHALSRSSAFLAELVSANQSLAFGTLVINLFPIRLGPLTTDGLVLLLCMRRR
jgi:hypothetical protein